MPFAHLPTIGGFVESVESAETLRVCVLEVFEFGLEEDVGLGDVAEHERDFGAVGGVIEDGAEDLVHSAGCVSYQPPECNHWRIEKKFR